MIKVLLDTNILIDAMLSIEQAKREIGYYPDKAISIVTWMELMAGLPIAAAADQIAELQGLLAPLKLIRINDRIALEAARLRQSSITTRKIALTDAIILATANLTGRVLVTRNKKDFAGAKIRIPYELETVSTVKAVKIRPSPI